MFGKFRRAIGDQPQIKAWANFDATGSGATIRASYNVSSVTRMSAGLYYVNFAAPLPDDKYSVLATTSNNGGTLSIIFEANSGGTRSSDATVAIVQAVDATGTPADFASVSVVVIR